MYRLVNPPHPAQEIRAARSSRSAFGPSESAFAGSSCTSTKMPEIPTATAAEARGSMNCGWPPEPRLRRSAAARCGWRRKPPASPIPPSPAGRAYPPPDCCSRTTIRAPSAPPGGCPWTPLYPPRDGYRAARRTGPFFTLTMRPVRPASSSRSVWRQRKAGIWMMSTTSAAGATCDGFMNVGNDGKSALAQAAQNAQAFGQAGSAVALQAGAVGLVERRFEDVRETLRRRRWPRWRRPSC